jgi:hypothetical protein
MFWTHGSLFVEYIKVKKKLEMIWWIFDKKKRFLKQKKTCPHVFFGCFKDIKGLLKHCEFSWKLCSFNSENIKNKFKILTMFLIYNVPMMIFRIFYFFKKDFPHILWFLISFFCPKVLLQPKERVILNIKLLCAKYLVVE